MRHKVDLLRDLGVTNDYNPHAGVGADTKDVVLIEVLIDIRDQIPVLSTLISRLIVQTTQEP